MKRAVRPLVLVCVCSAVYAVASFQTFVSGDYAKAAVHHRKDGPNCQRGVTPAQRHDSLVYGSGASLCAKSLNAPIFEQQWMAVDINQWVRHPATGKPRWIKQGGTKYIQTYDPKQSITGLASCQYYGEEGDERPVQVFVHFKVEAFGTYWSADKHKNNTLACIGFEDGS